LSKHKSPILLCIDEPPVPTESAYPHAVSGVSSCYAVKPSALQKTRRAMSPRGSLAKNHHSTTSTSLPIDKARHGRRGPPPRRPALGKPLHNTTRPARTPHRQAPRFRRRCQHGQRRLDITDEQELGEHVQIAQKRDEPASSRRKTKTPAHDMR